MVNHHTALRVEVAPFRHLLCDAIREGWRVGDLYIIATDVSGEERFFIAEAVCADCFGVRVEVVSRPFLSFHSAHKIANSSARALRREMRECPAMAPSALRGMLRALVAHQTTTTKTGARYAR
jgi:hypothetical protein